MPPLMFRPSSGAHVSTVQRPSARRQHQGIVPGLSDIKQMFAVEKETHASEIGVFFPLLVELWPVL